MIKLLASGEHLAGAFRAARTYLAVAPLALPFVLATTGTTAPVASRGQVLAAQPPLSLIQGPAINYALLEASPLPLPRHGILLPLTPGDSLQSVLRAGGLKRREASAVNQQFATSIDTSKLKPGDMVHFDLDEKTVVQQLEMRVTGWGTMRARRGTCDFVVSAEKAPERVEEKAIGGKVGSSIYSALRKSGESARIAGKMIDIFQWDVDFYRLDPDDSFSVVVEKKFAGNDFIGYGEILAATVTHKGQTFEAFRHQSPDGSSGYFARDGKPMRKQFLKAPLKLTRITSGFSMRRFHPILQRFRAHPGVDYGAPTGTPVMTTADGVVMFAGYHGGEGNVIKVRHNARIYTSYLHLSKFAKDIRPGARVRQGDVIGYVGTTGLSTGPHLDYRISDGGKWLNPLELKSITPDPLRGDKLRYFRAAVSQRQHEMSRTATLVPSSAPARRRPALF